MRAILRDVWLIYRAFFTMLLFFASATLGLKLVEGLSLLVRRLL
jgi:hypothetical protein